MQDLIDRLAGELARSPEPGFDIASTVASGRKVVRRRRIAAGGGILAAALVIGGTAWLVVPGDDGKSDSNQSAVEPTPTPTPTDTVTTDPSAEEAEPVVTGTDGEPVINPAAEILEQDRWPSGRGEVFDIYTVRVGDREYYAYIGSETSGSVPTPAQGLTLQEWVGQSIESNDIAEDQWVRFDKGTHLVPVLEGLKIVDQRPDPGLGENFAGPGDRSALVEVDLEGTIFFLAVRSIDGGPAEGILYRRDDQITTIEQFRTFALAQYATNESGGSEGLR